MRHRVGLLLRCYVFLVALCLSIDWFYPTGSLLREFGARPATPLLTIGGLAALLLLSPPSRSARRLESFVIAFFCALLLLGAAAFALNMTAGWSTSSFGRTPLTQFLAQSAMALVAGIAILGNARIASRYDVITPLIRMIPVVAAIHLLVWCLEAAQVLHGSAMLDLFKPPGGATDRASGLHSEPSYYGTMAALFAFALFVLPARGLRRGLYVCVAIALVATSIVVTAKTFVVVAGAQAMYLVFGHRYARHIRAYAVIFLLAAVGIMYFYTKNHAALSVEDNLSTAMRFGSAQLGVNVAAAGYGVLGIGIGQFHFFYKEEFAPDYLLLSKAALSQMGGDVEQRASTFNFYVRVLLETGALGFLLLMYAMISIGRIDLPAREFFLLPMFVGAAGFLLTQDTYFYPPLVFTSALIIGRHANALGKRRVLFGTPSVEIGRPGAGSFGVVGVMPR